VPRQLPPSRQRGHTAGINELQPGQIDENLRGARCDDSERSRNTYSVYDVKIPPSTTIT
jgi:hypothetical protein